MRTRCPVFFSDRQRQILANMVSARQIDLMAVSGSECHVVMRCSDEERLQTENVFRKNGLSFRMIDTQYRLYKMVVFV